MDARRRQDPPAVPQLTLWTTPGLGGQVSDDVITHLATCVQNVPSGCSHVLGLIYGAVMGPLGPKASTSSAPVGTAVMGPLRPRWLCGSNIFGKFEKIGPLNGTNSNSDAPASGPARCPHLHAPAAPTTIHIHHRVTSSRTGSHTATAICSLQERQQTFEFTPHHTQQPLLHPPTIITHQISSHFHFPNPHEQALQRRIATAADSTNSAHQQ